MHHQLKFMPINRSMKHASAFRLRRRSLHHCGQNDDGHIATILAGPSRATAKSVHGATRIRLLTTRLCPLLAAEAGLSCDLVEHPTESSLERRGGLGRDLLCQCSKFFGLRRHGFELLAYACARQFDKFRWRLYP